MSEDDATIQGPGSDRTRAARRAIAIGSTLVLLGIALVMVPGRLDGFVGGLASGAGLALALLGVAVTAGRRLRNGDAGPQGGWWLPSEHRGQTTTRPDDRDHR